MTEKNKRSYRPLRVVITVLILTVLMLNITYSLGSTDSWENVFSRKSIDVEKVWVDPGEQSSERESVYVDLYRNGALVSGSRKELNHSNGWKGKWTNLQAADDNGREYIWSVNEVSVPGYTTAISGNAENGFVITNTRQTENEKGRLFITKAFNIEPSSAIPPNWSATVRVTGPGYDESRTLTASNTIEFDGLTPGQIYTITESNQTGIASYRFTGYTIPGAVSSTTTNAKEFTAVSGNTNMTITNSYTYSGGGGSRGRLVISKAFEGVQRDKIPSTWSATVRVTGPGYDESRTLTASNTIAFDNLTTGQIYTITESDRDAIAGYTFVSVDGTGEFTATSGTTNKTITNNYKPTDTTTPTPTPTPPGPTPTPPGPTPTPPGPTPTPTGPTPTPPPDDTHLPGTDVPGGGMFVPPDAGDIPRTGDDMDARLWLLLLAACGVILRYVLFHRKPETESPPRGAPPKRKRGKYTQ